MGGGTVAALTEGLNTQLRPGVLNGSLSKHGIRLAVRALGGAGRGLHSGVHWLLLLSVRRLAEIDSYLAPLCLPPEGLLQKVDRSS